jgi:hypothetical protein
LRLGHATFREIGPERRDEFVRSGHKERQFFPHRLYYLPKCGPDGYKLASWMCGAQDPASIWELVLYGAEPLVEEFPRELFFDDDVVWHQQQFGRPGQVATANLVLDGPRLYSMVHISDLVQRISRRREHKTRIENRFAGWNHMLLNGILNFALELGATRVHTPTAELATRNTDPARTVQPELFERVYDRNVAQLFPARREDGWWVIDVRQVRELVVVPETKREPLPDGRTICVCHDIERGLGHVDVDPGFAAAADERAPRNLEAMLAVERELGCTATYNVVGLLLEEVRGGIEAAGHCVAFHGYDHHVRRPRPVADRFYALLDRWRGAPAATAEEGESRQLNKCRELDYRIKGYRAPQSLITPELSDDNLCFHNFEWLAVSDWFLGTSTPYMTGGIVKLPILIDDFDLHRGKLRYEEWEDLVVETLAADEFGAVSLHDCYGDLWLPRYPRLLERIRGLGRLRTMDEAAAEITLSKAV